VIINNEQSDDGLMIYGKVKILKKV